MNFDIPGLLKLERGHIRQNRPLSEGREWGVRSMVVESAFLGRPGLKKGPKTLVLKGFGAIWGKDLGRPKNADPATTDPMPHSRPSDLNCKTALFVSFAPSAFRSASGKHWKSESASRVLPRVMTCLLGVVLRVLPVVPWILGN